MKKFLIITIFILFPLTVKAVDSFPSFPMSFYGTATLNNVNLPVGTKIQAYIYSTLQGEVILKEAGIYGYDNPTKIKLVVGNFTGNLTFKYVLTDLTPQVGCSKQEYVSGFVSGSSVMKNLVFDSASCSTTAPTSSGGGGGGGGSSSSTNLNTTVVATSTSTTASTTMLVPQVLGEKITNLVLTQLEQILIDAAAIYSENIDIILDNAKSIKDSKAEKITADKYLSSLTHNENLTSTDANRLNFFITYGTVTTKILGAGERAGVINSYKVAFGKLPKTEAEWQDVIKIANGRWPSERSVAAEAKAKLSFKKIYGRDAKMDNANDNAAITIMAYGLRPSKRNTNSEKVAIMSFKYIYKRAPSTAVDWDIVRAIAYSGAKR
ncbi:MAG: hypothetical protein WC349_05290 [Patescibacteria group bacterium]|jgi:hypothetical protein